MAVLSFHNQIQVRDPSTPLSYYSISLFLYIIQLQDIPIVIAGNILDLSSTNRGRLRVAILYVTQIAVSKSLQTKYFVTCFRGRKEKQR